MDRVKKLVRSSRELLWRSKPHREQGQVKRGLKHHLSFLTDMSQKRHPATRASTAAEAELSKEDAIIRLHHYEKIFEDPVDVSLLEDSRVLSEEDRKREGN